MSDDAFTNEKLLWLEPWMEIKGELRKISRDDSYLFVEIDGKTIAFRRDSTEASYIHDNLSNNSIGREIAILKTDLPEKPLVIRLIS